MAFQIWSVCFVILIPCMIAFYIQGLAICVDELISGE